MMSKKTKATKFTELNNKDKDLNIFCCRFVKFMKKVLSYPIAFTAKFSILLHTESNHRSNYSRCLSSTVILSLNRGSLLRPLLFGSQPQLRGGSTQPQSQNPKKSKRKKLKIAQRRLKILLSALPSASPTEAV